ncbi:MAG: protein disulfide oxidoreductase [Anaerolineales bacterium]|jgi:glutaredoxin-like protein
MSTKLLNDDIQIQVKKALENLREPVDILFFGTREECDYCEDTLQLVGEVAELSGKLGLKVYDIEDNPDIAREYNVNKTPGLVLTARDTNKVMDYGVRFAGIPSGHEFSSLIEGLILVSGRDSGLSGEIRKQLRGLKNPVLLQVFVTPTCPYCPRAVVTAHQMALESEMVQAEMVEAMEFPELSERFGVNGVPQTTINSGAGTVVGAVPEQQLLLEIQNALA